MKQIVVDIIDAQLLERIAIHGDACLKCLVLGGKIRQFCGNHKFAALVFAQSNAQSLFGESLAVARRCVEIVHAMSNGIIHQAVHLVLVDVAFALLLLVVVEHRQAHHAITKQRYRSVAVGHVTIGHLVGRHFATVGRQLFCLLGATSGKRCRSDSRSCTHQLQEIATANFLLFTHTLYNNIKNVVL